MNQNPGNSAFVFMPAADYQELLETVRELKAQRSPAPEPAALDFAAHGLDPLRTYTKKEALRFLGLSREASLYDIDQDRLPRVKRAGKGVGWLGIHLLCYKLELPPVDVKGAVEAYRAQLLKDRPVRMRPVKKSGESPGITRVL